MTGFESNDKDYYRQAERPETLIEKYGNKFKGDRGIQRGRLEEDWEFWPETIALQRQLPFFSPMASKSLTFNTKVPQIQYILIAYVLYTLN
jgi:hypothetical protein